MDQDKKGTVLVVGDDLSSLGALFEHLDQAGFKVLVAQDGVERSKPDVILLDVKLPDLDGFELRRHLKEKDGMADIPVIFLTVVDDVANVLKSLDLAVEDYVTKPFEPEEVVARVEKHLTLHNLQKQLEEQNAQLHQEIAQRKRVEEELQKHQERLEELAEEHTAELAASNERLRKEITERLQVEVELKIKDSAIASSINGIGITDLEGTLIYANDSLVRMWGYESADEMLGRSLPEFWEGEGVFETVKALREKSGRLGEDTGKRKDGSVFPVQFAASMIKDEAGNPAYMFGSFFDITERKKAEAELQTYHQHLEELVEERTVELKEANEHLQQEIAERMQIEEALRESEATARVLLNAPTDIVSLIDAQGIILDANETMAHRFGRRADELLGTCVWDLFPPDVTERRKAIVEQVFHSGEPVRFEDEQQGIWNDNVVYPVFDGQGKVTRVAIWAHDISERVQAEEALRESEERATAILNATTDTVSLLDRDGTVLAMNAVGAERYGRHVDELLGVCIYDLVPPDLAASRRTRVEEMIGSGKPVRFEDERGGRVFDNSLYPVFDAQGEVAAIAVYARDITERKKAEEALRDSERRLNAAQRVAHVASYERDFQTGEGYWSDEQYRLFGYEPGEIPSSYELFRKHVHPDDRAMVTETIEEGLAEGKGFELDCRYMPRDGEVRYAHIICDVGLDDAGKPRWMHGTFQDITERVQAEEALRESEEKYRDLVEKVSDVIYVLDTEGVLTYVSSAIESFLGFSPSEVVGRPIFKFLHPEDVQLARNTIQKLKSGQSPGPKEYRLVTKSGEVRWMRTSSQPVLEGEQTTGVRGVLTDITDRKQMEEALRTSQQLLQSALDALSANIAILDEAGKIMAVNASWRAFADENDLAWADYGVDRNYLAVADSASGDSAEGAQEAAGGIGELLSGQRDRFLVEYPCHRPGEERWFIMRATRFESSEGVRVAVSHENITERKRAERQIEQAAAVAERERLARELHDAVTQALFSASLVADTLPRIWERYPEEGRRGLEELRRLTHGALAEMRTLLLELRPDVLSEQDLGVLLRQLTDGMMARMRIPVATTVVGDCSLPAEVQIALYRIAQEALNNIAKHARASRAAVSLDCEPDRVTLRISDDGQGFDPEAAQPHQLGMKIMHERAQAIGASIRAKSQPGQGTELVVTWTGDGKTKDGHLRLSPTRVTVQAGRIAKDEGRGERGGCP